MPRFFVPITIEDLKAKIDAIRKEKAREDEYLADIPREWSKNIEKDLAKVEFDFENCDLDGSEFGGEWCGYHTLDNGLTFLGVKAGGDWELPIFFIVYWDGKNLRAYIPTEGNPWNTTSKQAFGNDPDADYENAKKRWPEIIGDKKAEDMEGSLDMEFNSEEAFKDIQERILRKE